MEQDVKELFEKLKKGDYTPEEEAQAQRWLHHLNMEGRAGVSDDELLQVRGEMWAAIEFSCKPQRTIKLWPRIVAAAAALLVFGTGLYFYTLHQGRFGILDIVQDHHADNDIAPGKNAAILTFANGEEIVLSNKKAGVIVNAEHLSYNDGTPVNHVPTNGAQHQQQSRDKELLRLSTPRGGQYQLSLNDGTRIYLNAASSISYPSTFEGKKERLVELTGEAYFVVKHNAKHPFKVISKTQVVEDIGTEFNVNAYADETSTKTTLIEGSARVIALGPSSGNLSSLNHTPSFLLKPGEQSILKGEALSINHNDPEDAIGWKNNMLIFDNESLGAVMRKISRWYNVDIEYRGVINKEDLLSGRISKNRYLSSVAELLEATGIKLKIEGRKLIVMK